MVYRKWVPLSANKQMDESWISSEASDGTWLPVGRLSLRSPSEKFAFKVALSWIFISSRCLPVEGTNKQVGCHYTGVLGDKSMIEFSFLSGCPHLSNRRPSVHWERSLKVSQWRVSSCPYCKATVLTTPPFLVMLAVAFPHHVRRVEYSVSSVMGGLYQRVWSMQGYLQSPTHASLSKLLILCGLVYKLGMPTFGLGPHLGVGTEWFACNL